MVIRRNWWGLVVGTKVGTVKWKHVGRLKAYVDIHASLYIPSYPSADDTATE